MDAVKSHIELLSEDADGNSNYVSWRFKINLTLKTREIYDIALGSVVRPAGDITDAEVKAWIKKDLEAQTIVGLNVSGNIASKIATCKTAKEMLDKLKNLYGKRSDVSTAVLQRKFFCYEYDLGKSAVHNCMEILQIVEDLATDGDKMQDSWIMTRILNMLPPKLHHFRTAWDNISLADKTIDTMIERLRLEEDRLNDSEQSSGSITKNALLARTNRKQGQYSSSKYENNPPSDFKCGQKGHMKRNCRNKACTKYIQYCKRNYACNSCGQKGKFAEKNRNGYEVMDINESGQPYRRALVTVGLSITKLSDIKSKKNSKNCWYQDCAATQHMTSHRNWFINFVELESLSTVLIGDATKLEGTGIGDIELEAFNGKDWYKVVLRDVLYVPKLSFNLFSVGKILDKGYVQTADRDRSIFRTPDRKEIVAMAGREGSLFRMELRREGFEKCFVATSIKTWHERLAHQNIRHVKEILDRNKIPYTDDWDNRVCEGCVFCKKNRVSHPPNQKISKQSLDLVHVDLGEMNKSSLGGAKYFLLFKDDFSHY